MIIHREIGRYIVYRNGDNWLVAYKAKPSFTISHHETPRAAREAAKRYQAADEHRN